jgi:hypothetical protein
MLKLFQNHNGSRGSLGEIWIDEELGIVKKILKPDGITIKGTPPYHTDINEIAALYENENYWATRLQGNMVVKTHEFGRLVNEQGFYIIQEYLGPDLMFYYRNNTLHQLFPTITDQIVDMFAHFKEHNVHKINNALSNLTGANGRIKAFDFKYATTRTPASHDNELYSIKQWVSKINPELVTILANYI